MNFSGSTTRDEDLESRNIRFSYIKAGPSFGRMSGLEKWMKEIDKGKLATGTVDKINF